MSQPGCATKAEIRSLYKTMRLSLTSGERSRLSRSACAWVLRSAAWKQASRVALYVAVRGETDTADLLEDAWAGGKTVLLPRYSADTEGEMRLCFCAGPDDLKPGHYGIPEPLASPPPASDTAPPPDLFIVPGVAFTPQGQRLGQGGGYYDRLLARSAYANATRMGLAYGFQLLPSLPEEAWDLSVHAIATEKGILWTR